MRIYFVLEHVGGKGGVETVVTAVTKALSTEGHDVHVFLPFRSTNSAWEGNLPNVHYYYNCNRIINSRLESLAEKSIGLANTFHNLYPPDVVIATHVPQTSLYSKIAIGNNNKIPIVSWLHNPPERFYEPESINYADIHWAISKGIGEKISSLVNCRNRVHWIGNPVELDLPLIEPTTSKRFVYIGRLENQQKRVDLLLKGFSNLNSDWTLEIFGTGSDEENIKENAKQLGIQQNISFHGWVSDAWQRVENITALVLTSDFEGMPMVIGEALARGVPVISTDCETGPSDLVENGINGWLFPVGDAGHFTRILEEACDLSSVRLHEMSKAARASVQPFSMIHILQRMRNTLSDYIPLERWGKNDY